MKMRLVNGEVVDLSDSPEDSYHPQIASEFVDVPEGAPSELSTGFYYVDGVWTAPDPVSVDDVSTLAGNKTSISVARFIAQFTLESQIKIELARAYTAPTGEASPDADKVKRKAGLDVLYRQLEYLNQTGSLVDVSDLSVQKGLDWMAEQELITIADAERIKRGVPS